MDIRKITAAAAKRNLSDIHALQDYFECIRLLCDEDEQEAHRLNKDIRRLSARYAVEQGSADMMELNKRSLLFDAPVELDAFMQYAEWNREPSKRFWLPRRKQLMPVCNSIQDLMDDKLDILAISLPPGTGKSTLEIFLHAWSMGKCPDNPSLASGHSGMLTGSIYDGVLSIISDKTEYLWSDVFPEAKSIITNAKEQTIDINKKHRFSSLTCRAIGASLTGATRCEKLLTADDLCSGIEEAMSRDRLDKLWTAYTNDLKSRKKLGCKELHLATRWSVHDVIGRLEVMYGENPRAKFIVIPALDENEKSNFSYSFGVGFDEAYFEDMKSNLDDASFRALFMNQPIEREGLLYHEDELRRYFELPDGTPDAIIGICDTKDTGVDFGVLPVGYLYGSDYYVEDCVCTNAMANLTDACLSDVLLRNNVQMCRFESNSAGGRIADKVHKEVKERGGNTHITKRFTTSNKETRIVVNAQWVKEHCLFKDKEKYRQNSDYGKMIGMLVSYTMSSRNKHDDVPDAMALFAEFAQSLNQNTTEIFKRPF